MTSQPDDSLLDRLIDEFLERRRRGERPDIEEYAANYPQLAGEIREAFPALAVLEELAPSAPAPTEPGWPSPAVGHSSRLGEFWLLREIGRGGMGVVYEAVQESLGRHVAVKVLPPAACASPMHRERFRREAQSAARLHHTNIVGVYGSGEDAGVVYFAMQYIQGQPLDAVLAEVRRLREAAAAGAPGPPGDTGPAARDETPASHHLSALDGSRYFRNVAEIGRRVADALAYAHARGVVHRDIKPSNLLLDHAGTVWVTDFGLAHLADAEDLTRTGDVLGTLRYMAPEQLAGQVGPQCDVYSLGLTLYEMVTLRPAFAAAQRGRLIEQVRDEAPEPPSRLEPRLPRDLETIILRACEKEPARRYQGAAELTEDLGRFLADQPIRARRAGPLELAWRWCRRNRAVALLLGLVFTTLLTGAVTTSVFAVLADQRADDEAAARHDEAVARAEAEAAEKVARREWARAEAQKARAEGEWARAERERRRAEDNARLARTSEYSIRLSLALRALTEYDPLTAARWLGECAADLRGWEWRLLDRRRRELMPYALAAHTGEVRKLAWSPDGRAVVSWGEDGLAVRQEKGRKVWSATVGARGPCRLAFSPDGRRLLFHLNERLIVLDAQTGKPVRQWAPDENGAQYLSASFARDGGAVAAVVMSRKLETKVLTLELSSGAQAVLQPGGPLHPGLVVAALSDDGTLLATLADRSRARGADKETLRLWGLDEAGRALERRWEAEVAGLAPGPLDSARRRWKNPLEAHGSYLRFSPDGARLALGAEVVDVKTGKRLGAVPSERGLADMWDARTGQVSEEVAGRSRLTRLAVSPDRRLLARSATGVVYVTRAPRPGGVLSPDRVADDSGRITAFRADGRLAASLVQRPGERGLGAILLWEPAGGREVRHLAIDPVPSVLVTPQPRLYFGAGDARLCWAHGDKARVWDVATGQLLLQADGLDGGPWLSPDGSRALVQRRVGNAVEVLPLGPGRAVRVEAAHAGLGTCAFDAKGRLAALPLDDPQRPGAVVVDLGTGKPVVTLRGRDRASGLALSPDGRRVAVIWGGSVAARKGIQVTLTPRSEVFVHDAATGRQVQALPGSAGVGYSLFYSPDGAQLVTVGPAVRVWDAATGIELLTWRGARGSNHAFTPDGHRLTSRTSSNPLRLAVGLAKGDSPALLFWDASP